MTQQPERVLEMGAPARLVDDEAGVDETQTVIGLEIDLAQRERVVATLGSIPDESTDEVAELAKREDERQIILAPSHVSLTGPQGKDLDNWQDPSDLLKIDGEKVRNFPGGQVVDGSIPRSKLKEDAITGDLIGDEQIGPDHFSEALKEFIKQSGGGDGKVRFQNFNNDLQALICKIERYPAADRVFAADPIGQKLTGPITDTESHRSGLVSTKEIDFEIDSGLWEFLHYQDWTFSSGAGTATYFSPNNRGRTMVRFIIPSDVLPQPVHPLSSPAEILLAIDFRILEIINPHRHGSILGDDYEFEGGELFPGGVSFLFWGDARARKLVGDKLPTSYRTQWYDKQGKYGPLCHLSEPAAISTGDLPPELGVDLIANGIFSDPTVGGQAGAPWQREGHGWLFEDPATGQALGFAKFELPELSTRSGSVFQEVAIEEGETYRLIFDITHKTSGRLKVSVGGGPRKEIGGEEGTWSFDLQAGEKQEVRFDGTFSTVGSIAPRSEGANFGVDNVRLHKLIFPESEGERYIMEIWVAAQGVTITDPKVRLVGRRPDPEYRAGAQEGPTGDWEPNLTADCEEDEGR